MANPRQVERDEASKETARKLADETSRAARAAAEAGAGAARAGADMVQRNADSVQQAWVSGSKSAGQLIEQSMDRFARAFGIAGESTQQATQQSSRNLELIVQSGTILAGGMQTISVRCSISRENEWNKICIAPMRCYAAARRRKCWRRKAISCATIWRTWFKAPGGSRRFRCRWPTKPPAE